MSTAMDVKFKLFFLVVIFNSVICQKPVLEIEAITDTCIAVNDTIIVRGSIAREGADQIDWDLSLNFFIKESTGDRNELANCQLPAMMDNLCGFDPTVLCYCEVITSSEKYRVVYNFTALEKFAGSTIIMKTDINNFTARDFVEITLTFPQFLQGCGETTTSVNTSGTSGGACTKNCEENETGNGGSELDSETTEAVVVVFAVVGTIGFFVVIALHLLLDAGPTKGNVMLIFNVVFVVFSVAMGITVLVAYIDNDHKIAASWVSLSFSLVGITASGVLVVFVAISSALGLQLFHLVLGEVSVVSGLISTISAVAEEDGNNSALSWVDFASNITFSVTGGVVLFLYYQKYLSGIGEKVIFFVAISVIFVFVLLFSIDVLRENDTGLSHLVRGEVVTTVTSVVTSFLKVKASKILDSSDGQNNAEQPKDKNGDKDFKNNKVGNSNENIKNTENGKNNAENGSDKNITESAPKSTSPFQLDINSDNGDANNIPNPHGTPRSLPPLKSKPAGVSNPNPFTEASAQQQNEPQKKKKKSKKRKNPTSGEPEVKDGGA